MNIAEPNFCDFIFSLIFFLIRNKNILESCEKKNISSFLVGYKLVFGRRDLGICIASPFVPNRAFVDNVGDVGDGVVIKITETREHCRIFFEFSHGHTVTNVSNIIYKVDLEIH